MDSKKVEAANKQFEIYRNNLKLHKEEKKEKKQIEDYEYNLKIHQESIRKILDIILSTSMPHQVHNIKTILWVNLLFIIISSQILKDIEFEMYHLIFYISVAVSILLMLFALISNRYKWYGGYEDINYSYEIYDKEYPKIDMLGTMIKNDNVAIAGNRKTMNKVAKFMRYSLISTLLAFFSFLVILIFHYDPIITEIIKQLKSFIL